MPTRRSERVLRGDMKQLGFELLADAPIFRTRGRVESGAEGGRPWARRPYTKDKLATDFAAIREQVFGRAERRTLADFRCSGVVEATADGADGADGEQISAEMAKYLVRIEPPPPHLCARGDLYPAADGCRAAGRTGQDREQRPSKSVMTRHVRVS